MLEGNMSRRLLLIASILVLGMAAVAAYATSAVQARSAARPAAAMMGPEHMLSQPAFLGYYDGKKDTYLNTDTSNKAQATAMHINYSSALASFKGAPAIYLVQGRAAAGQIATFGSVPGASDYSPLWEEQNVTWKAGVKPTLLTSDNTILALQKKGKLTVTDAHIVLNCPIVKYTK
jgi:hypothetical protein